MKITKTIEHMNKTLMPTYSRNPLVLERGKGARAWDEAGREYIDFSSGIGVNSLGFCNEAWTQAVCAQANTLQHVSNLYYNTPNGRLAEKLCAATGYDKAFFANSGAEANECAVKLARKYSFEKYGENRSTIITLVNSFHGRTVTMLSATGQEALHDYFFPFTEGFCHVEANDIEALRAAADDTVCAIMFEYIQGEGGVLGLDEDFVDELFRLAAEKDILTIADEVQTGIGRTGKFLAGMHYGRTANITTLAKGLGGGLPIGVCLADKTCGGILGAGSHGSTFGGNPVCCAAGLAVMDIVTAPGFDQTVREKGELLRERLTAVPQVTGISGAGLMLGLTLAEATAREVVERCLERGLLVLTAKDKLRLLPPLNISRAELEKGLDILIDVLEELKYNKEGY